MHTQIVWVYGWSAAGKETFIRTVAGNRELCARLGWEGKYVVPCQKSIELIAQYQGDPVGERREEILEEVKTLVFSNPGSVILIKGQDLDLQTSRPARLKEMLPRCEHRIIYLYVSHDEMFERIQRKSWFDPNTLSPDMARRLAKLQTSMLSRTGLPIRALHSGDGSYVDMSLEEVGLTEDHR